MNRPTGHSSAGETGHGSSLRHVLWIGGSPCSGKSSIVERLAERYDLGTYHCDAHWDEHTGRARPDREPLLYRVAQMSWDEIWGREVAVQVREEFAIYRQEFGMILDDLHKLPDDRLLVAEGTALLPDCVAPLLTGPQRAIWIVPTEAFQKAVYPERGPWVQEILSQCTEPVQAFRNWMDRDVAFARQTAADAGRLGLRVIWVDGREPLETVAARVEEQFRPYLAPHER